MTNEQIENVISTTIWGNDRAMSRSDLEVSLKLGEGSSKILDRALERMKRKGTVRFNKDKKVWEIHGDSSSVEPTSPSQVSAPPPETEVQLEDANLNPAGAPEEPVTADLTENQMNTKKDDEMSKIDAALNLAKQRKADNNKGASDASKASRPRLSAEEKAKRDEEREAEKAQKKAAREAARAEKQAAKEAQRKPAHLSKVDKARSKLPSMDDKVESFFNELTVNFTGPQLSALAAHLQHHNRESATKRALDQKVKAGDKVEIVSGDSRFVGKVGTVSKAQRIRCYVEVEGAKKPVYLFTSDVKIVVAAAQAANG